MRFSDLVPHMLQFLEEEKKTSSGLIIELRFDLSQNRADTYLDDTIRVVMQ